MAQQVEEDHFGGVHVIEHLQTGRGWTKELVEEVLLSWKNVGDKHRRHLQFEEPPGQRQDAGDRIRRHLQFGELREIRSQAAVNARTTFMGLQQPVQESVQDLL